MVNFTPLVQGHLWTPGTVDDADLDCGFGRIELPWEPEPRVWATLPGSDPVQVASASAHLSNLAWRAQLADAPAGSGLAGLLERRPTALATVTSPVRSARVRGDAPVSEDFTRAGSVWANTLVESMTARQKLIAHLQAEQLADIADLSRAYPGLYEELPAEIGMALRTHEVDAARQLELARRLTSDLVPTWHALHNGQISVEAASVIHQTTDTSTPEVAARVEAVILKTAGDRTPRRIRRRCLELVARFDPDNVKERHRKAAAERTVTRQLAADGMASLTMWAPAQNVAVVWHTLTTLGRQAKTPGDGKTAGNRRCDALTDLCHQLLTSGSIGLDIGSDLTGSISAIGVSGVVGADQAGADPACAGTSSDTTGAASTSAGEDVNTGSATNVGSVNPLRRGSRRPISMINVTVPHTVLLGGDAACDLTGYGTITADQARQLIAHDAQLRRLLLDPRTHQVLDVGRATYRPPAHLADHVRARDVTCSAFGCDNPAVDCDLDHLQPFKPGRTTGGDSSAINLDPLCRHHHRSKDHGGSSIERTDHGYRWTTPLGRTYLKVPPTLYEPGDSDGPLSGPGNGYIPLWARTHQQADGSIAFVEAIAPETGAGESIAGPKAKASPAINDEPPF